jgi:RHS repeat-associated protein
MSEPNEIPSLPNVSQRRRVTGSLVLISEHITYSYSSTQNNGKITSQMDNISGEQVVYTYDALNRLASAAATSGSWGQSYAYDGFGNLTAQTVTAGSAPAYNVAINPATNQRTNDCADANGNAYATFPCGASPLYTYDVENRLVSIGTQSIQYSYAPGNKRVWRGLWTSGTLSTDEITFWGITGQKLATYQLSVTGGVVNQSSSAPVLMATQTGTNYYFGGKLVKNAGGYVGTDRLGSIGHFYPYGQEKPSATTNGTEKFTGYFRDSETGLDYAMNRFHSPGTGRFMTPDPYLASGRASDPGSWNRYAYTRGDPVNRFDPSGFDDDDDSFAVVCDPNDPDPSKLSQRFC